MGMGWGVATVALGWVALQPAAPRPVSRMAVLLPATAEDAAGNLSDLIQPQSFSILSGEEEIYLPAILKD